MRTQTDTENRMSLLGKKNRLMKGKCIRFQLSQDIMKAEKESGSQGQQST